MSPESLFLINAAASLFMCGVIWFVQLVHYPSFRQSQSPVFINLHRAHVSRTGLVVIPPMIIELGSSAWLAARAEFLTSLNMAGLILVVALWISTFLIQVPIHRKLQQGFNRLLVDRLVKSNWIRTLLWSLKAGLSVMGALWLLSA